MNMLNKNNRSNEFFETKRKMSKEKPAREVKGKPIPSDEQLNLQKMTSHFQSLFNLTREMSQSIEYRVPDFTKTVD